jgi:hypothetical protein
MAFTLLHDTFTGTPAASLTGAVPSPKQYNSVVWDDFSASSLAPMVYQAGGSGIQGPTAGGYSRYDLTGSPASQTITFPIHSSDASANLLSYFRRTDPVGGTNSIEIDFNYAANTVNFNKHVNNVTTVLSSPTFAFSTGTVYTCVVTFATSGGSTAVTVVIGSTTVINAFVIADAAIQSSAGVVFGAPATIGIDSLLVTTPSATALTVTGPSTLTTGTPGTYTATTDLPAPDGGLSLAESATVFAATFSPSPKVIAAGATSGTFTATASTAGTGVVAGVSTPSVTVTGQSVTASAAVLVPTTITITGPSSGVVGTPLTLTATLDHPALAGGISYVPSGTPGTEVFAPNPVTFAPGAISSTFTVTASTAVTASIGGTAS